MTTLHSIFFLIMVVLAGCGGPSGSTIGKFVRDANLPLYFTISGAAAGQGAVYRIATLERAGLSEPELVVGGLDFPTGLTMDSTGHIYVAEKQPAPYGKIKVISPGSNTATVVADRLHNPIAVAVDTFNRLYVVEGDNAQIYKTDAAGDLQPFKDTGLSSPRDIYIDGADQI